MANGKQFTIVLLPTDTPRTHTLPCAGNPHATNHPNPVPEELFCEAFLVDTTIREIDRIVSEGRGPFFTFLSLLSPHGPVDPPGDWAHAYDDRPLPVLNYVQGEEARHP